MRSTLLDWANQRCVDLRAKLIVTRHSKKGVHLRRCQKPRSAHLIRPDGHHLTRESGFPGGTFQSAEEFQWWALVEKDYYHKHVHNIHARRIE